MCVFQQENTAFVCTSSRDRSVRIWNPSTGEGLKTLFGHEHYVGS